jgi:hypothetical protein
MRWLLGHVAGGVVRFVTATMLAAVCLMLGFSPPEHIAAIIGNPPPWLVSPVMRILILIIGMLVIAVLIFWDRLFANPLNTRLNILVDRAFATLDPEALAWVREHWASGRAPHSLGDALFAAGLIERDFVGFTGVKDELKPIIAKKLKSIDAIWRRIAAKTMARVQGQAIPILLVSAWLLLTAALVIFLWQYWRSARAVADSPVTIVAGSGEMRGVDEKFYSPTVTQSQASLQAGLYVADIRLSFGELKKDRHSELSMRVFNGTGRVIDFVKLSGQIKFSTPNNTATNRMGELPEPSLQPDMARSVDQLQEWLVRLSQPVPAKEADKILAMLRSEPIHFDLSGLNIEVAARDEPTKVERLPLWHGVSYSRGYAIGRITAATGRATLGSIVGIG